MKRLLLSGFAAFLVVSVFAGRASVLAEAEAEVAQGRRALAAGEWASAVAAFRLAARKAPSLASAWRGLGEALAREGDFDAAVAAFDEALRLDPTDVAAGLLKARTLLAADSFAAAAEASDAILAHAPAHSEALHLAGFARWADGRFREAEPFFRRALRADEGDSTAWLGLGLVLEARGETDAAVAAYRAALALDGALVPAHRRLGRLLLAVGRPEAATPHLRAAAEGGKEADVLALHRFLLRQGDAAEADRVLAETAGEKDTPRRLFARGVLAEGRGDWDAARDFFRRAYLAVPEDVVARLRYEEALIASRPATDAERVRLAHRRLREAERAQASGDLPEAERLLRRAVRLAPQEATLRFARARLFAERGAFRAALQEARRAQELTRDPAERFAILDAGERWVASALERIEETTEASFREVRLAPAADRLAFLRDTEPMQEKLGWLPGPWPRPRYRLALLPFEEAAPPFHPEIGRSLHAFVAEALGEREDVEITSRAEAFDGVVRGAIEESEEAVRITFRLETKEGRRLLDRTVETRGRQAFSRAAAAVVRAVSEAIQPVGEVLYIDGDRVFVNLGVRNTLRVGDTLVVTTPRGEEVVPGVERRGVERTAVLRVEAVSEHVSRAKVVSGEARRIHLLDVVTRRPT